MPPLTPEQKAWAEKKLAQGMPEDEVFAFLDEVSSGDPLETVKGQLKGSPLNVLPPDREVGGFVKDWMTTGPITAVSKRLKPLAEIGGKGAASYYGGRGAAALASKAPLPPWLKAPLVIGSSILGESAGQAAGELGRQYVEGEPMDTGRAKTEAKSVGIMSGVAKGAGAVGAYFGGVQPKHIGAAVTDPRQNLRKPTSEDWYALGSDVVEDTGARELITTQGRRVMEGIMNTADSSGIRVNGLEMARRLRASVSKSNLPTLKASDQRLLAMADDIEAEILNIDPTGYIKPSDFDRIFRRDFTQPKFDAANVPEWGPDFKGAHSKARDQIAEYFYKELGPEMGDAASQAHNSLMIRENLESELMPRTGGAKPGRIGQKMRATLTPTNISGLDTRKALEAYDAENGTNFSSRLAQLETQEAFKPLGHSETQQAAQIGIVGYKPRNIVSAMLVSTARQLLKVGGTTVRGTMAKSLAADLIGEAKRRDGAEEPKKKSMTPEPLRNMP